MMSVGTGCRKKGKILESNKETINPERVKLRILEALVRPDVVAMPSLEDWQIIQAHEVRDILKKVNEELKLYPETSPGQTSGVNDAPDADSENGGLRTVSVLTEFNDRGDSIEPIIYDSLSDNLEDSLPEENIPRTQADNKTLVGVEFRSSGYLGFEDLKNSIYEKQWVCELSVVRLSLPGGYWACSYKALHGIAGHVPKLLVSCRLRHYLHYEDADPASRLRRFLLPEKHGQPAQATGGIEITQVKRPWESTTRTRLRVSSSGQEAADLAPFSLERIFDIS